MIKKIKKLADLPSRKKPTEKQIEKVKRIKAIEPRLKVIKRKNAREYVPMGTHEISDAPAIIKGFRKLARTKTFQIIIREPESDRIVARTFFTTGKHTAAEQMAIKMQSLYRLKGPVELIAGVVVKTGEPKKPAKKAAKKPAKKAAKKPAKKAAKKPAKKAAKKRPRKKGPA